MKTIGKHEASVSDSEAHANLSDLLNQVYLERKRITVERSGIPIAVLVSPDDAVRLERLELLEEWRRVRPDSDSDLTDDEIVELTREVRREIAAERAAGQ
jgi:prevent-host-death family protein